VEERILGRTGRSVSVVGLGTWQLGADWGEVAEADALAVLDAAAQAGVTFLDTADVYGDGRSERLIGQFLAANPGLPMTVATKMGRRVPQDPAEYTLANFRAWTDRSRANLGTDTLDLVQLHCPPTPVFSTGAVYDALDTLVAEKRIAAYGVSVETCAEALAAIARPGTASVQIIFNAFRRKPLEEVLPAAQAAGVGIIARVPLASGLLSGRYTHGTTFGASDHRTYNRHGEAFDVGETFSGVDFDTGVDAAREFAGLLPPGLAPAQAALRWIIQQPGVTTVIPGARNPEQARQNAAAAGLPPLTAGQLRGIEDIYDRRIRAQVHDRWLREAGPAPASAPGPRGRRCTESAAADDSQPGLGRGVAVDRVDRELVRGEAHDLPAIGERGANLLLAHPARPPDSRLLVAEAHHVVGAAGLDDARQAGHVPGPVRVVEDVEETAVGHGAEPLAQQFQVQRVGDLEPGRQAALGRLGPGLLDGEPGHVHTHRVRAVRRGQQHVLPGAAASVEHPARQQPAVGEAHERVLRPADVPGCRAALVGLVPPC
jgi:aryl-alcohol dehydrogenase-like predicted oxidoreductase